MAEANQLRWWPRRRSSPWLVIAGVLIAIIGVVADKWNGPSWLLLALAIAAAGGAVLVEYCARAATEADDRHELVDRSSGVLDQGRFPLVAAVGLAEFRVHRTVVELGYIRRDRQDQLRDLLLAGTPALVVGHSLAGKTRMAVQVVRDLYHDWPVWIPERPDGLSELLSAAVPEQVVVWLDDLEAYLTAEEPPRVGWLDELRRRGCRVVATIRASKYEEFQPSGELRSPLEDLLGRFEVVWLEADQAERDRMAGSAPDPRTAAGIRGHGVGEYVGGANLALERYRIGQSTHPLGEALVRAAADWRRVGLDEIPEGVLMELARVYLPAQLRVSPGDELAAALAWTGDDIGGRVRLMEQTEHGWRVFDYLLDHLDEVGDPVPAATWAAALRLVTESTALPVGYAAYAAGRLEDAATAFGLARESSVALRSATATPTIDALRTARRSARMALTTCRECGNNVSDSAPSCPNCGIPSPGGQATLEIRRVSRLTAALVPMAVWVNSNHVGNLGSGKSFILTVPSGTHRIECHLQAAHTKEGAQEVTVPAGRRLVVTVSPSRFNGKPDFSPELA